jgi:hypothetical protein
MGVVAHICGREDCRHKRAGSDIGLGVDRSERAESEFAYYCYLFAPNGSFGSANP